MSLLFPRAGKITRGRRVSAIKVALRAEVLPATLEKERIAVKMLNNAVMYTSQTTDHECKAYCAGNDAAIPMRVISRGGLSVNATHARHRVICPLSGAPMFFGMSRKLCRLLSL